MILPVPRVSRVWVVGVRSTLGRRLGFSGGWGTGGQRCRWCCGAGNARSHPNPEALLQRRWYRHCQGVVQVAAETNTKQGRPETAGLLGDWLPRLAAYRPACGSGS